MSQSNNSQDDFGGEERRKNGLSYGHIDRMIEVSVNEALSKHKTEVISHFDGKVEELMDLIKSAFPHGDPHGHRMAHEAQIKNTAFWDRVKASLAEKLAFGVVSGGLVFLGMAAWEAFKTKVGSK